MEFPLVLRIGSIGISAHVLFEASAYAVGFWVFRRTRSKGADPLDFGTRLGSIAAAIVGAAFGSWLLGWLADEQGLAGMFAGPVPIVGRKTIVGALLGGLISVETWKRFSGVTRSTGDAFVVPLCVGIVIGRLGCISAGIEDGTHGLPTGAWWGLVLGEDVARHPVRVVEMVFAAVLGLALLRYRGLREGDRFRAFMFAYLTFRLAVDFLKPGVHHFGLTAIQWACVFGLLFYLRDVPRLVRGVESRDG